MASPPRLVVLIIYKSQSMDESWSIHRKDLTGLPIIIKLVVIINPLHLILARKKPVRSMP